LAILGARSAIPTLAAARMQSWALVLSAYDYVIEYKDLKNMLIVMHSLGCHIKTQL
jgi:hypothetical protein